MSSQKAFFDRFRSWKIGTTTDFYEYEKKMLIGLNFVLYFSELSVT